VNGKTFDCYMTNEEWEKFKKSMSNNAVNEFSKGDGGDLVEKNGYPPKMSSYGSSSRMIYNLSKNKDGFHFEKKLHTTIGGTANLDGFYDDGHRYVFVEAKCHEIYSENSNIVSKSYKGLYEFINTYMADSVQIDMNDSKKDGYMNVEYTVEGEQLLHFDLKQMICHLLGIATGILKRTLDKKQIDFIYLLYDPTELDISKNTKDIIENIYERTRYECNLIDFSTLFRVIILYLMQEKYGDILSDDELDMLTYQFTFILASQEFYPFLIK
ncbi:MAG: hypothetical protein IKA02_04770, partial [Clostridia bacterium]|nr:hypothetical protein [Clostridia bacterium]